MRIIVRVPATLPANDSGSALISGPRLVWCQQSWPSGDDTSYIYIVDGVTDASVIEWTVSLGDDDETTGPLNTPICYVRCKGGSGTVTVTVDGAEIGTIEYSPGQCFT